MMKIFKYFTMDQKQKMRKVDILAKDVNSWWGDTFVYVRRARIKTWKAVLVIMFFAGAAGALMWSSLLELENATRADTRVPSPLMKSIKTKGCVADGIFTGYGGDTDNLIAMIEDSECVYLHRSVETWTNPPDFRLIEKNIAKLKNRDKYILGMFLAEAINPTITYIPQGENRLFNFGSMCKKGSEGFWGENTCKANFESQEYRDYLQFITEKAIDAGIQSFLFGQIYFQDNGTGSKSRAKEIVGKMRSYAKARGKEIVIGAQTNDIEDEEYLRLFDYIEGGVGVNEKGDIENGPCFSRWWKKEGDRCWALLWHEKFAARANDVLLHFDWSGLYDDDMSIFARMDQKTRVKTMEKLYQFFLGKNMGFMMPYLAVINENNGSCIGPAKNFYAPADIYTCKDEDEIKAIMVKQNTAATPAAAVQPAITPAPPATPTSPPTSPEPAIPSVSPTSPSTEPAVSPATPSAVNQPPAASPPLATP